MANSRTRIAYLAPEMGALTSTFIYREAMALEEMGFEILSFSTLRPKEKVVSEEARRWVDETIFLFDRSWLAAAGAAIGMAVMAPGRFLATLATATADALTGRVPRPADRLKVLLHFAYACMLAGHLKKSSIEHIHTHFAHVPTTIAMYAAKMSGIPYSFMGHANDLFERPTLLEQKLARAAFVACISEYNLDYLARVGAARDKLLIVRCSLDVDAYAWQPLRPRVEPFEILSVGRMVEKKGFTVLVDAVAALRERGHAVRCRIAGDGPLRGAIEARIAERRLGDCIELLGSQPQERVQALVRESDAFVLACVVAQSGDQDGIPVSLMEAMAVGVPVVSTRVSGIPELIEADAEGLLAEPGDAEGLAAAIESLIKSPEMAAEMARAARNKIESEFETEHNAAILAGRIRQALATAEEGMHGG